MLGVLMTLVIAWCYLALAMRLFDRWLEGMDPAARCGISGLLGLAIVGFVTLPIGLLPYGLKWGGYLVIAGALLGGFILFRESTSAIKFRIPEGVALAGPLAILPPLCLALLGAIAPSTAMDWDSLAYHLAVPKIWLVQGQIHPVTFIHHSNFPFLVDNLYIWGLWWGGSSGAKAFSVAFLLFGVLSIFGLARERYGNAAGWWAAISFVAVPAVLWESGTAYIDVAHGLFAGIGAALLFGSPRRVVPGTLLLGFAVASKYTGLQSVAAVAVALGLLGLLRRDFAVVRMATLAALGALAIGSPWYIKNVAWTGNPVYPFFYERFGGAHWDQFAADIYREEQKTFGVPNDGPGGAVIGFSHAVLGVAYQPGRYNNPAPKLTVGDPPSGAQGSPTGAIGATLFAAALTWLFLGKGRDFERAILTVAGISLVMWFLLSQQSRYILSLVPILAILAGGAIKHFKVGPILALATGLQGIYSVWFVNTLVGGDELKVALGLLKPDSFARARTSFYEPAQSLNELCRGGKVALFDEVFGYLLDVPYFWANPGHSTEIGYDRLQDGLQLGEKFRSMGITHVYVNISAQMVDPGFRTRWIQAMGLSGASRPFTPEEAANLDIDLRTKWKRLVAEAVASGQFKLIRPFSTGLLFEVAPQ